MSDSLRDAVSAAFDSAEGASHEPEAQEAAPVEESAPTSEPADTQAAHLDDADSAAPGDVPESAGRARDDKGRFIPKAEKAPAQVQAKPQASKAVAPTPSAALGPPGGARQQSANLAVASSGAEPPASPQEAVKAPQSWTPAEREHFGKAPPEVQRAVMRRERETALALQDAAEAKRLASSFQQTLAPFEPMLRAEGQDPIRAFQGFLHTAQALRTAPPAHKAALIANVVRQFGIPIDALDAALAGQAPPESAPQAFDPAQLRQQLKQELMQDLMQQRMQTVQQKSLAEVQSFGQDREFFDDVREDMADLLSGAARRGVPMSLEDAYTRAIRMHPEIWDVIQQREAAKAANASSASTQRARAAASSVRTSPATPLNGEGPKDLRAAIEAAMAAEAGR